MSNGGMKQAWIGLATVAMIALGAWMFARSRRRKTPLEQARYMAGHTAEDAIKQARSIYRHREDIAEDAIKMAEELLRAGQRTGSVAVHHARDIYEHRDDLMDDVSDIARDTSKEFRKRYRKISGRLGR